MWDNKQYISQAKPVTLEALLRENDWVIRKTKEWEAVSDLGSLKGKSITLGKVYISTDRKGKNPKKTINDIAIAEIREAQWTKEKGVAISAKLFARTRPQPTELNVTVLLAPPTAGLDWMARVSLADFAQFTTVVQTKSLTCLVFEIGRKADVLFSKFLKEEALRDAASAAPRDPGGDELRDLALPKQ